MKNLLTLVFAGIIGGFVAFGIADYSANANDEVLEQVNQEGRSVLTSSRDYSLAPPNFVDASSKAKPAVVHIKSAESKGAAQQRYNKQKQQRRSDPWGDLFNFGGRDFFGGGFHRQQGSGSGVILSKDGYVVTNNHVVGFADDIIVTLDDGREMMAKKVGTDPKTDLAVLKIEGSNLPYLNYGNSDKVQVGEWVLAVGNPFDYLRSTVTAGIVGALGRDIDIIKGKDAHEEFIQTDAAINPGNSGGALVNTSGQLIGINTAIATPTGVYAGYSFAIPSNLVQKIVEEIIANPDPEKPTIATSPMGRAQLGIQVLNVKDLLESEEDVNLTTSDGIYVEEVANRSSAQFAGILPGDVIVRFDKSVVKDFTDLKNAISTVNIGDTKNVEVIRNGKRKTIPVRFREGL